MLHPIAAKHPKIAAAAARRRDAEEAAAAFAAAPERRRAAVEAEVRAQFEADVEQRIETALTEAEKRIAWETSNAAAQEKQALADAAPQLVLALEDREDEIFRAALKTGPAGVTALAEEVEQLRVTRRTLINRLALAREGMSWAQIEALPVFEAVPMARVTDEALVAAAERAQHDRHEGPGAELPEQCQVEVWSQYTGETPCGRHLVVSNDGWSAACPAHPVSALDLSPTTLIGRARSRGAQPAPAGRRAEMNRALSAAGPVLRM